LLFFESAFGICIGCKIYNLFNKQKAQLCPGGVCELPATHTSGLSPAQAATVALFAVAVGVIAQWVYDTGTRAPSLGQGAAALAPAAASADPTEAERCRVPEFAKALGHEGKWKLHNNCQ
jgi:hypothetical protein